MNKNKDKLEKKLDELELTTEIIKKFSFYDPASLAQLIRDDLIPGLKNENLNLVEILEDDIVPKFKNNFLDLVIMIRDYLIPELIKAKNLIRTKPIRGFNLRCEIVLIQKSINKMKQLNTDLMLKNSPDDQEELKLKIVGSTEEQTALMRKIAQSEKAMEAICRYSPSYCPN
ncbi:MAG: hypothetical protein WC458_01780 [Patescibacteria group bacterium]